MERDVIVVGAGPGGATTAIALAQAGRDVLLIDRQPFPRDKTCGDGIPCDAIENLYDLGLKEKFTKQNFFKIHQMLIGTDEKNTIIATLNGSKRYKVDTYIIPRTRFDHLLQQHAVESGAEFLVGRVKKPLIENGKVVGVEANINGQTQPIRSKIVVGADGVTSVIARALRPPENKHVDAHRAVAIRAYVTDFVDFLPRAEFYLYKDVLPGYAWVFPTGKNEANIGLGIRLDKFRQQKRSLEEMLEVYLEQPFIKSRLTKGGIIKNIKTWQLNFGSQKNLQYVYERALLVGDAAGLINPLTGGGIDNAIISGRLAAQTIDNALKQNDLSLANLKVYETKVHNALWKDMRRSYLFNQIMAHFPFAIYWLVRLMPKDSSFTRAFLDKL